MQRLKKDIERVRLQHMLPGLSQGDSALVSLQPVADPREAALQEQLQQVGRRADRPPSTIRPCSALRRARAQERERCQGLCAAAEASKLALNALQGSMGVLRGQVQDDFRLYLASLQQAQ